MSSTITATMTTTTMDYAKFVNCFGERLEAVRMSLDQSFQLYEEKGHAEFLKVLREKEAFQEFCDEYYDYMRERWNACGGSMWDAFEVFRSKYNGDYAKYWAYLRKC